MSSSFWSQGADKLRQGLQAKRDEIDRLTEELRQTKTDAERRVVEERLRTLIEEEDPSATDADHSLFLRERS